MTWTKTWLALPALLATLAIAGPTGKPSGDPVQVQVKSGDGQHSMVFVARNGEGDSHSLKLQSKDGHVIVEAEPDPDWPWLGVLLDDSQADDGDGGDAERTLTVRSVAKGSPAERAGLEAGDVITGIDGTSLAKRAESGLLGGHAPGDRVRLQVRRDDKTMDVTAELSGHPGKVEFANADGLDAFAFAGDTLSGLKGLEALQSLKGLENLPCLPGQRCPLASGYSFKVGGGPRLGVVVEDMSDQLARFFGTEAGKGLLVKDVVEGSAADKAGVQAGDVLMRVGRTDVHSVADIQAALEGKEKGDALDVEVLRHGSRKTLKAIIDKVVTRGAFDAPCMNGKAACERVAEALAQAQAYSADAAARGDEQQAELRALEQARSGLEHARHASAQARVEAGEARAEALRAREEAERERMEQDRERESSDEDRATPEKARTRSTPTAPMFRRSGAGGRSIRHRSVVAE